MNIADAKQEVLSLLEHCSLDEVRVLLVRMRRMHKARAHCGPLDLSRDKRDWIRELCEENADRGFYADCAYIALQDEAMEKPRSTFDLVEDEFLTPRLPRATAKERK